MQDLAQKRYICIEKYYVIIFSMLLSICLWTKNCNLSLCMLHTCWRSIFITKQTIQSRSWETCSKTLAEWCINSIAIIFYALTYVWRGCTVFVYVVLYKMHHLGKQDFHCIVKYHCQQRAKSKQVMIHRLLDFFWSSWTVVSYAY